MKKNFLKLLPAFLLLFLIITNSTHAIDYIYNGIAKTHLFSYSFPSNWFARTFGERLQGFSPNLTEEKARFEVMEFDGQSLKQVKNFFVDENIEFVEFKDEIFSTKKEDLIAKKAIYLDIKENKKFAKTIFKRGNIILATSSPNLEGENFPYDKATNEIIKKIYNSFSFNDGFRSYIDFENQFSFSFPEKFLIEKSEISNKISSTLKDPVSKKIFWTFEIFKDLSIDETIPFVKTINEKLDSRVETEIAGIENAEKVQLINLASAKKKSYFFIPLKSGTLVINDENIETNYPASDYHNSVIKEILASIEFFNAEGEYYPFLIFTDVRENHHNANAINYLANSGIVQGYNDKTFGPEKDITRAELTKMLVASVKPGDLSDYKDCFPDVKDDWYAPFVCFAKENNWIEGYKDGLFKPTNKINRAEALKIIYEVLEDSKIEDFKEKLKDNLASDISESAWYYSYYTYFQNRNLLDKNHIEESSDKKTYKYFPDGEIKRQEVAETIYRMKLF